MDGLGPLPDGSRRKVERVDKKAAQKDLDELLSLRAQALEPPPRRQQAASFVQVIDAWLQAGCPIASPTNTSRHAREESPNTIANARYLLDGHVRPAIGRLWVDRTAPARLEELFADDGFVFCTRNATAISLSSLRRGFKALCEQGGLGREWTTYELRHSFVSLVADLAGHVNTKSTQGYRHPVRPSLPHAIEAWDRLLERRTHAGGG